jgi:hypothetical protein
MRCVQHNSMHIPVVEATGTFSGNASTGEWSFIEGRSLLVDIQWRYLASCGKPALRLSVHGNEEEVRPTLSKAVTAAGDD